jgi:putative transcriptional regulator
MSRIKDAVHETAKDLHDAGLMDGVTLREFDALCLPPVKDLTPSQIRQLRRRCNVSQAVFAAYMNVGKTTVQHWEQGHKKPKGTSMKLLDIVDRKGLEALA